MQAVARIQLYGGLVGEHLHHDARALALCFRDLGICADGLIADKACVVAVLFDDVGIVRVADPLADAVRRREIEGRARNRLEVAVRNESFVRRRDAVGIDLQDGIQHVARAFAVQVEIRMVGHVDRSAAVGHGKIIDLQFPADQRIADLHLQVSGVILVAVGADEIEGKRVAVRPFEDVIPDFFIEADFASVQMVAAIVAEQRIFLPVDDQFALFDAVAEAADQCAEIAAVLLVSRHVIVTEHDVHQFARFVLHLQ